MRFPISLYLSALWLYLSPTAAIAACPDQSSDPTILLQKQGGTVVFADETDKTCPVRNDANPRFVIWRFQGMKQDCMPPGSGICRIELQQVDAATQGKVSCTPAGQDFQCKLNVHRLKSGCDLADPASASCSLSYLVFYRDQVVDPTIIINPRPSVD